MVSGEWSKAPTHHSPLTHSPRRFAFCCTFPILATLAPPSPKGRGRDNAAWMVDVIHRRCQWSPDFPRVGIRPTRDRLADSRMPFPSYTTRPGPEMVREKSTPGPRLARLAIFDKPTQVSDSSRESKV